MGRAFYFLGAIVGFALLVAVTAVASVNVLRAVAFVSIVPVIFYLHQVGRRTSTKSLDVILRQFPGPLTFYPSRFKWTLMLGISGMFTGSGLRIMQDVYAGWFLVVFVVFSLLGGLVASVILFPGASALTLDGRGFEIINMFRRTYVLWPAV